MQTGELQQAEETIMQDGERPHIGRSARHASKVQHALKASFVHYSALAIIGIPDAAFASFRVCVAIYRLLQQRLLQGIRGESQNQHTWSGCKQQAERRVVCSPLRRVLQMQLMHIAVSA